jgi:hypothetical protein
MVNRCVLHQLELPPRLSGSETEVDVLEVEEVAFIKTTDFVPAFEVEGHGRSPEGLWRFWSLSELSDAPTLERDLDPCLLDCLILPVEDDGASDSHSWCGDGVGQTGESPWGEEDVVVAEQGDSMSSFLCCL